MVTPTADNASVLQARNWKCVPKGMVRQIPGSSPTVSSCSPCLRHISPRPATTNQISSTVRCVTALELLPAPNSKCAMPPEAKPKRTRTSEPSGATAVRSGGRRTVANLLMALFSDGLSVAYRFWLNMERSWQLGFARKLVTISRAFQRNVGRTVQPAASHCLQGGEVSDSTCRSVRDALDGHKLPGLPTRAKRRDDLIFSQVRDGQRRAGSRLLVRGRDELAIRDRRSSLKRHAEGEIPLRV